MSAADPLALQLAFFAELRVEVGPPLEIGATAQGLRRIIPITGGHARGDGWQARVLPGGADYQQVVGGTLALLDAHYVLEAEGGERLYVRNRALRHATPEATARLLRGEPVDPGEVYFRCQPTLETAWPALAWVNERLFAGAGVRRPDAVEMRFYLLA